MLIYQWYSHRRYMDVRQEEYLDRRLRQIPLSLEKKQSQEQAYIKVKLFDTKANPRLFLGGFKSQFDVLREIVSGSNLTICHHKHC